ncbi:biosynthetic arginine decarboxylase [Roseibacillus persicicus]|uniref:Arginine decarboxylase n=1 Tax=Roseibacillus persicicus TaxID=454148 RepID=A0A918TVP6_9BACT|nr:biosynthetic arginine decarboxylase [Roseibacillus persicicus]MDQ8190957.1 biosynthetic arginine decarboxylase [Roseibacillus persicicus]GHC64634.1 arginine decarboxylase [Roseibacillus persicicus]
MPTWIPENSRDLYGLDRWGNGYFDLNKEGEVTVKLRDQETGKEVPISLPKVIEGMTERGWAMPLNLRFRDLLDRRIEHLNGAFQKAIASAGYQGKYRGVYPIKVNQQQQVVEEISEFGKKFNYGLECGSKPELLAALAYQHNPDALIICNGYKDTEFIDLALRATQMGLHVILVLEMPSELPSIIDRSKALGIRPELGIRFRLSTKSEGHWADSGGDRSVFGLNTGQVIDTIDILKENDFLDTLKLFHFHQGSQLPNIRSIREAVSEASRVYVSLVQEGAPMGFLDLGGGLAVDYDGSSSSGPSSANYSLDEYAADLIETVQETCDQAQVAHPTIVTESGRAIVAYYSVLVFNILDVTTFHVPDAPESPSPDSHPMLLNIADVVARVSPQTLNECFNDSLFYRDKIRALFTLGTINLRDRALGEKLYWHIMTLIANHLREQDHIPEDLTQIDENLTDFYYANLSVFQSLPDAWAIGQLFPIMPLHRHHEEPTRPAIIADITCDCDGKIDKFIDRDSTRNHLPLHPFNPEEGKPYYLGAFLTGAYQETLGDLHNLLGDPNVVSVSIENGELSLTHEVEGDTVADVLTYVEYNPKDLEARFRRFAEASVKAGRITAAQRKETMQAFRETLNGYTYYED